MNLLEQLDDFWRDAFRSSVGDRKIFEKKYADFVRRLQDQVSHLPQEEQNRLAMQVVNRNAEYIAMAQRDQDSLKARLGLPMSSASADGLTQVAAETIVRATIWQSIAALFRSFR